ncbi:xylose operon regulatory protein [Abditibacteriota bacterium]|nr:xylose operon regulatory protein [Abditibacteriota bacterium]
MITRPNVALIIETAAVYGRQTLHGIASYQRTHGGWSVFLDERELRAPPPDWLLDSDCDGVICRSTTPSLAEKLLQSGLPVVDLNDRYGYLGIPRIGSDMPAIGRMAAEHLLERGFRHIAYCGFSGEVWSDERLSGVAEAVGGSDHLCGVFHSPSEGIRQKNWQSERTKLCDWLQTLPRPLGIVACNDVRGYNVLDACRVLNLAVPEEVAVVGVDNSETFCDLCVPSLSSILPNAERIGYEAALLLDHLMSGDKAQNQNRLIAPQEVITRQSSDILAVDDPSIAQALRFIREHSCEGISITDVLSHVPLSRSTLERGFRHFLGHSPQEEIRRVRLKRVKHLLLQTDWSLSRIAEMTGYNPDYMIVQFKHAFGETPAQWRQANSSL